MVPIEARGKVKTLLRRDFIQMAAGATALAVAGRAARAQAYLAQPSKVTVQFATNRNWIGGKDLFGSDFRPASDGLVAAGSIDVYYKDGTWHWDRNSLKFHSSSTTAESISEFILRSPEKAKLVFLPGFDCTFKNAMISSAQVCSAYEVGSRIYCFSWPSQGQFGIIPYLIDKESAYRSGHAISLALNEIFKLAAVHRPRLRILCHSMGNRALSAAIQETGVKAPQLLSETHFEHALLMAADEDFNAFQELGKLKHLLKLARNINVYTNDWDVAMVLSNLVNGRPPMGSFGPANFAGLPGSVIWIDCSEVANTGLTDWGHQYFAKSPQVAADAHQVLKGIRPIKIIPRIPDPSYPGRKFVIPWGPIA
jgi:hypothetical protein